MTYRFEPSVGKLGRQWAWAAVVAGLILGLGFYFAEGTEMSEAVAWGVGGGVASFAFAFLRDYWLHFWTVEISEDGVRAVRGGTEYVVPWGDIIALNESHHGESWTIKWGKEQTLAPHYLAPESLSIAVNAYTPSEAARLVELLRSGVREFGILEFSKSGVALPTR
jgi:hypothetical protein